MGSMDFDSSGLNDSRKLQGPPSISFQLGYPWEQRKAQRRMGPIPGWTGPVPKGSEVYVSRIPRDFNEDDLYPIFSRAGEIYELRLAMDLYGLNRGYAFVRYTKKEYAESALKIINGFRVKDGMRLHADISVDNCRLFVGALPRTATREDVLETFNALVHGVVDVIMYQDYHRKGLNRGFAFLEFESHELAAAARRVVMPNPDTRLGRLMIDWAEPEPTIDENVMKQVKILYVRHLLVETTDETLAEIFNFAIQPRIVERVKKIDDYAFVHFSEREDAEEAMRLLQNAVVDGVNIHIEWARPKPVEAKDKSDSDSQEYNMNKSQESSPNIKKYEKYQRSYGKNLSTDELNNAPISDGSTKIGNFANKVAKNTQMNFTNNPWYKNNGINDTNLFYKNNSYMYNKNFADDAIWNTDPTDFLETSYQRWLMYDFNLDESMINYNALWNNHCGKRNSFKYKKNVSSTVTCGDVTSVGTAETETNTVADQLVGKESSMDVNDDLNVEKNYASFVEKTENNTSMIDTSEIDAKISMLIDNDNSSINTGNTFPQSNINNSETVSNNMNNAVYANTPQNYMPMLQVPTTTTYPTFQDPALVHDLENTLLLACRSHNWPAPVCNITMTDFVGGSYMYQCVLSLMIGKPFAASCVTFRSVKHNNVHYATKEVAKMALNYIQNIFLQLQVGKLGPVAW